MKLTQQQKKILAKGLSRGYITIPDVAEEYADLQRRKEVMQRFVLIGLVKIDRETFIYAVLCFCDFVRYEGYEIIYRGKEYGRKYLRQRYLECSARKKYDREKNEENKDAGNNS